MNSARIDAFLESAFRIRPGERSRVGLMFLYSLACVSAFIVGRTVRDTLFLSRYPVKRLPWMYVAIAVGVSLAAFLYSRVADRYRRDKVIVGSLAISSAALTVFWLFLEADNPAPWVYPALYILIEIVGGIAVIQFWTFANDIFSSREAKRLFGIVSAGGVMSNVICGFAIGWAANIFGPEKLIVGCVMLYMMCAACVRGVARIASEELEASIASPKRRKTRLSDGKGSFLQSKHLKLIAGIVAVTVLTITIVDYQFKVIARAAYEGNEQGLASFFGFFFGFTGIVACFIQFFVTGRLLEKKGVVVALLVLPSALVFGVSSMIFLVPAVAAVTFLGAATATKGSENVFRYTLNDSTTQLLYVPVPSHQRGRAKAFIDGIVKPVCIGASGLIILFLSKTLPEEGFTSKLSYLVLLLLATWIALIVSVRSEYVRSLLNTLKSKRLDLPGAPTLLNDDTTKTVLEKALASDNEADVLHALELLPAVDVSVQEALLPLLSHNSPTVRITALHHLAQSGGITDIKAIRDKFTDEVEDVRAAAVEAFCALSGGRSVNAMESFLEDPSPVVRGAAITGLMKHGGLDGILSAATTLKAMFVHEDSQVRLHGARVLGSIGVGNFYQPLLPLLQDEHIDVQNAAIAAAGSMKTQALLPSVIYKLAQPRTRRAAKLALVNYGPDIEEVLLKVLANEREDRAIRLQVPRVLSRTNSKTAFTGLLQALDPTDVELAANIARAAARMREHVRHLALDDAVLSQATQQALRSAYQTLAIIEDLALDDEELLHEALMLRMQKHIGLAFRLLSIRYPTGTINLVFSNLQSENKVLRANAIEVVDNIIDRDDAAVLLPLLDAQSIEAKVRVGTSLFELERHEGSRWLERLMKDDDSWLVACALELIGRKHLDEHFVLVEGHLGSTDDVIRETACLALSRLVENGARPEHSDQLTGAANKIGEDAPARLKWASQTLIDALSGQPA